MLDRSTSMNDSQKMQDTKEAAKSLVEKLMKNNTDLENPIVKVGIVTYGTNFIDSRYNKQTTSTMLSSVKSEVTTLIDNIPNKVGTTQKDGEATNIDAGLKRANTLLTGSTANQKAVILLSDGIPMVFNYNGTTYGNTQNDGEVCIEKDYWSGKCTKQMRPSEAAKIEAGKLKTTIYKSSIS